MNSPIDDFRTPGQFIKFLLAKRGWSQSVLSIILELDQTLVNKLVNDKRPVTADVALKLGDAFIVEPEHFLELQTRYDLAMARITSRPDPGRATRAKIFGDLPIAEMIKRGWLAAESVRDTANVEASLLKFFRVNSLDEIEILPHAAKRTNTSDELTGPQRVWLNRVRLIAEDMMTPRYSGETAKSAVDKLKLLQKAPEELRKVPRILTEAGIKFVLSEHIPSAKIDGVCFWINKKPVIGMSLRYDRIDNFWFVLRHELEHVIRGHGVQAKNGIIDDLDGEGAGTGQDVAEEERVANQAAADFCVPRKHLEAFIARKAPIFAERDLLGFASTIGVHPGLVAGAIQRETGRYDRFRDHLVKVRHHIMPTAVVDGWGNTYPVED